MTSTAFQAGPLLTKIIFIVFTITLYSNITNSFNKNLQSNRNLQYDESFLNKYKKSKLKKLNLVNFSLELIN